VTLQTIADQVGVSRMTVSNAFSRPDQLSDALRERILAAAQELGYVGPDPAARALARGTSGAVGVLLTSSLRYAFTDDVAIGFLGAVAEGLAPTGLAITLLSSTNREDLMPARDAAMDGALVYSCDADTTALDWLVRRRLPLVMVDQDDTPGFPSVNVDDRGGARAAARHLVDLGHRRIAVLSMVYGDAAGFVDDPRARATGWRHVARERLLGNLDVLEEAGITPVVHLERNDDESALAAARAVLSLPERPTGVLCYSDVLANGVLRAAEELGLDVPGDVSVVGFDDSPLATRVRPALTTVRQDVQLKGRTAAAELVAAMETVRSGGAVEPRSVLLPTELVVRDSTAPA
jgi:DNA-binding LacI/PurR family transcriptional regulator